MATPEGNTTDGLSTQPQLMHQPPTTLLQLQAVQRHGTSQQAQQ